MKVIGLQFVRDQIHITQNADLTRIRGDLSMVENARDVEDASISKRESEFESIYEQFSDSPSFTKVRRLADLFAESQRRGVLTAGSAEQIAFVAEFQKILRGEGGK
jgi:hypothetical protein